MNTIDHLREVVRNGGGLASPFVHLSRQAHVAPDCQVMGSAEMYDQARLLEMSSLRDFAKILEHAEVRGGSIIQGHARVGGYAKLYQVVASGTSDIRGYVHARNSFFRGNCIISGKAQITDSIVAGNARVTDDAIVENALIGKDDEVIVVEGVAQLIFPYKLQVPHGVRVDDGRWDRPPFVVQLPYFCVCEDVNDKIKIGCLSHRYSFWREHGKKVLIKYGLPEDMFYSLNKALETVIDFKQTHKSPKGIK